MSRSGPRSAPPATQAGDFASLAERMVYLQSLRVGFALTVLGAAFFAPRLSAVSPTRLTVYTALYLVVAAAIEAWRRSGRTRGLGLVGAMLLLDGLYLAWVVYLTGGLGSPLRFLVYLHIIAVTLLASYRTGLKIALWYSLLYFVVYYAELAHLLQTTSAPGRGIGFEQSTAFSIFAFWLIAIGTAAFSTLNERELRRRRLDLEALARMADEIEREATPEGAARILAGNLVSAFAFARVAVLAATEHGMRLLAYQGPGQPADPGPGTDAIVARAIERRAPVLARRLDAAQDPRLTMILPFARNLVVVPMFAEDQPVGAVVAEHPSRFGDRIERRVVAMVERFAAYAALALRNAWLLEKVQRLAITDPLTQLPNRRAFEETLERELARAERTGEQLTLLMLDLDHFKDLNDRHGHLRGDEVLAAVGRCLADNARGFDTPARYGGEEFAVILPACTWRESLAVGDRLRRRLSNLQLPEPLTASAGVATFPVHATDLQGLVEAADEALYESKRAGRDRITRSNRTPQASGAVPVEPRG